jgi:hypothetical protein
VETVVLHAVHVCMRMVSLSTQSVVFVGVPGAWRLDRCTTPGHCTAGVLTVSGAASAWTRLFPVKFRVGAWVTLLELGGRNHSLAAWLCLPGHGVECGSC